MRIYACAHTEIVFDVRMKAFFVQMLQGNIITGPRGNIPNVEFETQRTVNLKAL